MKKNSGPSLRKFKIPMVDCGSCKGSGFYQGTFHQLSCPTCNGAGGVTANTHMALETDEVVVQLRLRLTDVLNEISHLQKELESLKPYMSAKKAAELQEAIYPKEHTLQRAANGRGGFGD